MAVVHAHSDSVFALRIVFSVCLALVLLAGVYVFRIRKQLFDRDPQVAADHWAARNLRALAGGSRLVARGRSARDDALAVVGRRAAPDIPVVFRRGRTIVGEVSLLRFSSEPISRFPIPVRGITRR